MVIDAVTIVVAILLAGLGMFVGFGRTLRFFTDGIFGFIISVVFCFAFGGLIASIGPVAEGISWLNNWLGGVWSFFATIPLGNDYLLHHFIFAGTIAEIIDRFRIRKIIFDRCACDAYHQ